MVPSELYLAHCKLHNYSVDSQQQAIIEKFDIVHKNLLRSFSQPTSLWSKLIKRHDNIPLKGIYLWGSVGSGKTMLMDIFYRTLPEEKKIRFHFHDFMRNIHQQLNQIKDKKNPLSIAAKLLIKENKVLCLDEFYVSDITDAMLMYGLLETLFSMRICLITTSNIEPSLLYKEGLQRARFIPAIKLLQTYTKVIKLNTNIDYRLKTLRQDGTFHFPLTIDTQNKVRESYESLTGNPSQCSKIIIEDREISTIGTENGVIWFDANMLFNSPRSQTDYIEIASQYHSVFISNLNALNDEHNDIARRLLNFLDIAYEHKVKLIISSEKPIEEIYSGKKLAFEFKRAISRLIEMQSQEYLSLAHIP